MKPRMLIAESERFCPKAIELLRTRFDVQLSDLDRNGLISEIGDYDYLWVRLRSKIDAEILERATKLKCVLTNTTGLNHVDLAECSSRGIHVLSLRGETDFLNDIRATAELTIALILDLVRHISRSIRHVNEGQWNRDLFEGHELYGQTAGIVGYGRLGRRVAKYLLAFDVKVLATGPSLKQSNVDAGISVVSLPELLEKSDIVSLHANYIPENDRFFGANEFAKMKAGSLFINTARGELVDESALLSALERGHLTGAALDVLRDENSKGMNEHPLVKYAQSHNNLLITPHIGGNTRESLNKTEYFLAKKLIDSLAQS